MGKKILFALAVILSLMYLASAITGSIGSAKMILRAKPGEEIGRSILVRNVNDIPVTVTVTPSGTLEDNINFNTEEFVLAAGKEKKVSFTIFADEVGTTETKINVLFTPEEGNGIGLSSNIIFVASNADAIDDEDEEEDAEDEEDEDTTDEEDEVEDLIDDSSDDLEDNTENLISDESNNNQLIQPNKTERSIEIPTPLLLLLSSTILLGILLALIFIKANNPVKKRKRVKGAHA